MAKKTYVGLDFNQSSIGKLCGFDGNFSFLSSFDNGHSRIVGSYFFAVVKPGNISILGLNVDLERTFVSLQYILSLELTGEFVWVL